MSCLLVVDPSTGQRSSPAVPTPLIVPARLSSARAARTPSDRRHRRLEAAIDLPLAGDLVGRRPEADGEAREIRGAERRRFGDRRPDDRDAEQVGLELHQRVVGRRAAVDAQLVQRDARSRRAIASSRSAT